MSSKDFYDLTLKELTIIMDAKCRKSNPSYLSDSDIENLKSNFDYTTDDSELLNHPLLANKHK